MLLLEYLETGKQKLNRGKDGCFHYIYTAGRASVGIKEFRKSKKKYCKARLAKSYIVSFLSFNIKDGSVSRSGFYSEIRVCHKLMESLTAAEWGEGGRGWPAFLLCTARRKKSPLSGSRILWERGSSLAVVTSSPSCTQSLPYRTV
jgi:hypothetical protein